MFSRLKELLSLQIKSIAPTPEPRSKMFPDYGLRTESEKLSASFDPFNFAVHTPRDSNTAAEVEAIRSGKLDKAESLATGKLGALRPDRRLDYALTITGEAHELRHYHDHFATTFGFSRIMATIQDGIEFSRMWHELKGSKQIKLPLLSWAQMDNAPEALKAYAAKRRSFVENFVLNDGAVKTTVNLLNEGERPAKLPTDAITVISVGGISTSIPMVDLNFMNARTDQYFQRLLPLGGNLLMEGNAFVIQRDLASRLLGNDYDQEIKRALMSGRFGDEYWVRYMAVDLYVSKRLLKHNVKYQLALSDVAMMAPADVDLGFEDMHPGWRFFKAVNAAERSREVLDTPHPDLPAFVSKITSECKWPSVQEVTRRAIRKWENVLKDIENRDDRSSFWDEIFRAVIVLHLKWLRVREQFPAASLEPELFYRTIGAAALAPPVYADGDGIWFQGEKGTKDGRALRQWFLFEHFQRQLLFSKELPCPVAHYARHNCPGDPIGNHDWQATEECIFSQLLDGLAVRSIDAWGLLN